MVILILTYLRERPLALKALALPHSEHDQPAGLKLL